MRQLFDPWMVGQGGLAEGMRPLQAYTGALTQNQLILVPSHTVSLYLCPHAQSAYTSALAHSQLLLVPSHTFSHSQPILVPSHRALHRQPLTHRQPYSHTAAVFRAPQSHGDSIGWLHLSFHLSQHSLNTLNTLPRVFCSSARAITHVRVGDCVSTDVQVQLSAGQWKYFFIDLSFRKHKIPSIEIEAVATDQQDSQISIFLRNKHKPTVVKAVAGCTAAGRAALYWRCAFCFNPCHCHSSTLAACSELSLLVFCCESVTLEPPN